MESVTVAIRGQGNKRISIRTSALEEKATACQMLQSYAADLKEGFLPYVQDVAGVLVPLIKFQYMDEVRAPLNGRYMDVTWTLHGRGARPVVARVTEATASRFRYAGRGAR